MKNISFNPKDMDPKEILVAMLRSGVRQTDIARELGVTKQHVHMVLYGRVVSHRIRKAISEATDIELEILWPSTYLTGGPKKPGRPRHH
jgi:lambda repressor-like predicted transcriptional regulator